MAGTPTAKDPATPSCRERDHVLGYFTWRIGHLCRLAHDKNFLLGDNKAAGWVVILGFYLDWENSTVEEIYFEYLFYFLFGGQRINTPRQPVNFQGF